MLSRRPLLAAAMAALVALIGVVATPNRNPDPGGPFAVGYMDLTPAWLRSRGPAADTAELPDVRAWYPLPKAGPAAPMEASRPTLFYASGWPGTSVDNPNLINELVSQGFVVVALVYGTPRPAEDQDERKSRLARLAAPMDFSSETAYRQTLKRAEDRLRTRAADAMAVLDWLESLANDRSAPLPVGSMDLARLGFLGYSFGGAVAAEARSIDPRFKAAVNMDGWLFGNALDRGVPSPFMMMSDATPIPGEADLNAEEATHRYTSRLTARVFESLLTQLPRHGGILVTLAGSGHVVFRDAQLASPLGRFGWPGRLSGARAALILNAYVTAFFSEALLGQASPLLREDDKAFPEVTLRRWNNGISASRMASPRASPSR